MTICSKLAVATLITVSVFMISSVEAQDNNRAPIRNPSSDEGQNDTLKKVLDGQYSPEIYHVKPSDKAEIRLQKQQINCLYAECASLEDRVNTGQLTVDYLLDARRRLGDAKLEFHVAPTEQHQVLSENLKNAKALEANFAQRMAAGLIRPAAAYRATSFRIEVELALLRLEQKLKKESSK